MTNRLDTHDRDVLQFRPDIRFIEPAIEPQAPNPIEQPIERSQLEDVQSGVKRLQQLAKAVNTLAAAVQARADEKARGLEIALDPIVDQDTIQAMRRHFPGEDPLRITFDQYKGCKDNIRKKGEEIGKQGISTPERIKAKRDAVATGGSLIGTQLGGYNTSSAKNGGLRPELNPRGIVIPQIDVAKLQIDLICVLINFVWKNFLKPFIVTTAGFPVGTAFSALPDKLCDPGGGLEIPDLFILGDQPPPILTGEAIPDIPTSAPEKKK